MDEMGETGSEGRGEEEGRGRRVSSLVAWNSPARLSIQPAGIQAKEDGWLLAWGTAVVTANN